MTDYLTIAIPVFERKDFFEEAIQSVLNQKTKCEIIVVDNNSSHDFFEVRCRELGVKYFKNDENIGMFANWNMCFKLARTEYVMILGDDDILSDNYVSTFIDALTKYPLLDIFFSDFEILHNENGLITSHSHILPFGYMENGKKVIEYGVYNGLGFPIISSIIKKEKFSGFYTELHASNDWAWLYENVENMSVFGEKNKLLKYRYHTSNDSKKVTTSINCHISILFIYNKILEGNNTDKKLIQKLKRNKLITNIFIYTHIERSYFHFIVNKKNRYSIFFKNDSSFLKKIFLILPLNLRKYIFRINLKLRIMK
jgi:glycosyltransferase involved in cell wall biosynthesis